MFQCSNFLKIPKWQKKLEDDTQIREAFQIFFHFECNIFTLLGLGDPFSTNTTRNSEEFGEKDRSY